MATLELGSVEPTIAMAAVAVVLDLTFGAPFQIGYQ